MSELLRTNEVGRGKGKHYHIVYMKDDGTAVSSLNNDHSHQWQYQQEQPPVVDLDPSSPTLGQVMQEAAQAGWIMMPDENLPHELQKYVITETKTEEKEGEIVEEVARRYSESIMLEETSRAGGYDAEDIYSGKHWDEALKKKLEKKGRAAETVNKTEGLIDNLSGYQRQNRTDIKFLATEGGDETLCDILNVVVKNVLENCSFGREESKVFTDSSITGRGLFNIYMDLERNFEGDIIVEKFPWDEASFAVHEKEDLSDCDMVFKEKWYALSKLKEMYPEKADEFVPEPKIKGKADDIAEDWDKRLNSKEFINTLTKQYKVVECQRKTYTRSFVLAHGRDGFDFDAKGWLEADVNAVKTIPGFYKMPRVTFKIRLIKIASTILLEDEIIDDDEFSLVPLYAKYRNGEFWGKIKPVVGLQRLINKSYSQFIDIINKVASYGWFYDGETFPTAKEKKKFKETSSSAGFLAEVTDISRLPQKVEGVKFPVELVNAIAMFNQDIREIMNVNLEMQGMGGKESGIAMKQKIVQQLIGNDFLFDNLSFAKKKIGQIVLKKIARHFTPERIMRIVASQSLREEGLEINGRPFDKGDQEAIQRLTEQLEAVDLTKYDVIVSESASSPSAMMGNFMMMLELAAKGVPIPPEAIMVFAPIPDKKKVMDAIKAQQEKQAEIEEKKADTEIRKTMIANQPDQGQPGGP